MKKNSKKKTKKIRSQKKQPGLIIEFNGEVNIIDEATWEIVTLDPNLVILLLKQNVEDALRLMLLEQALEDPLFITND